MSQASGIWSGTSSFPVRSGNLWNIYVDGQDAFASIFDEMQRARSSLYVTFAYVDMDFRPRPEVSETLADLFRQLAAAGVDVRVLFWAPVIRIPNTIQDPGAVQLGDFNAGPTSAQARWDVSGWKGLLPPAVGCHHQKTFVIDERIAFVGGMNSLQGYWDTPAHDPRDRRRVPSSVPPNKIEAQLENYPPLHDLFSRIEGPCVQDVATNFFQRWNGASFRHEGATKDLSAPLATPGAHGPLTLQITRTIGPHKYPSVELGEKSVLESYLNAITEARRFIYFENQYYFDHRIDEAIEKAVNRGVRVIGLLARRPDTGQLQGYLESAREWLGYLSFRLRRMIFQKQVELYCPGVSYADPSNTGRWLYKDVYVHAKLLIVDDQFVTLGSANISSFSMDFHSELNVICNDGPSAIALRKVLWREHLQKSEISDANASTTPPYDLWRQCAEENVAAHRAQEKLPSRVFPWDFPVQ